MPTFGVVVVVTPQVPVPNSPYGFDGWDRTIIVETLSEKTDAFQKIWWHRDGFLTIVPGINGPAS